MASWKNKKTSELFKAFLQLRTEDEVANFCRDLMTEPEIIEFANRWEAAQELASGKSQRQIAADTGTSIVTITRVNQWLKRGMGGYQLVIDRIAPGVEHHKPGRTGS